MDTDSLEQYVGAELTAVIIEVDEVRWGWGVGL